MRAIRCLCWVILATSVACGGSPPPAPPPPPPDPNQEFEKWVDTVAAETLRDGMVPSLSIAITRGSAVVLEKTYGRADIENDVPARNESVYRIASITKQFTAAAILRLVEQRRVSLDADVRTYLPELHTLGARITIRQLLNHTSGIQNITDVPAIAPKVRLDLTNAEILAIFQDEPHHFAPGANFLYNNSGYTISAMIIERLTGQTIADHMRLTFFEPLQLRSTSVCDETRVVPHRAHGYVVANGQLQNEMFISPDLPKGGGNICSTAHDLALWAQALASGRVVRAESYTLMTTPGALSDGRPIAYGLGLFLSELEGRPEVSHGGDFDSFTSFLGWYPSENLAIAVLQNSNAAPAFDGNLARRLVRRLLQLPESSSAGASEPGDAELNRVVGTYRIGTASIEVSREGSHLALKGDKIWHLQERLFRYEEKDLYSSVRNPELQLRFSGEGFRASMLSLTLHGRAFGDATLTRASTPQ